MNSFNQVSIGSGPSPPGRGKIRPVISSWQICSLPLSYWWQGPEEDKGKNEKASALAQLADDAQLNYRKACKWVENISCENKCCDFNIKCVNANVRCVCISFSYLAFFQCFSFPVLLSSDKSNPFCEKAFRTLSQYFWKAHVPKLELYKYKKKQNK